MKKTLLLSLAASTAMMAGGDIAPVQPAVEAPVAAKKSMNIADTISVDKVSGYAKVWYETTDKESSLFEQKNTYGDATLSVKAEGSLLGKFGYGVRYTVGDTLGLEKNIVETRRTPAANSGAALGTVAYTEEAYVTFTANNTTIKAGRQHLNTPFAFTENWNATSNTFDATVLINKSIDGVTLVAANVAEGNGGNADALGYSTIDANAEFSAVNANMLAVHTAVAGIKVNGYYFDLNSGDNANWWDASTSVNGVKVSAIMADKGDADATAFSASTKVNNFTVSAAYSTVDGTAGNDVSNDATGGKKTKLPTMGVYTDGLYVGQAGSDAWKVKAVTKVAGVKVIGQYVDNENDITGSALNATELDVIAVAKIGDLAVKGIFVDREFGVAGSEADMQHVRIITTYKF